MCHIFLLLPLFGLPLFLILPWEEAVPLYVGVGVLSAAFYSLLWRTMRRPASTGIEGMMGGVGTVFRSSEEKTKVFYRGEIWEAVSKEAIAPDERVEIIGYERMRLVVRRCT